MLKEIQQARNQRRRVLRQTLREREKTVNTLLQLRRGEEEYSNALEPASVVEEENREQLPSPTPPPLKKYFNE